MGLVITAVTMGIWLETAIAAVAAAAVEVEVEVEGRAITVEE